MARVLEELPQIELEHAADGDLRLDGIGAAEALADSERIADRDVARVALDVAQPLNAAFEGRIGGVVVETVVERDDTGVVAGDGAVLPAVVIAVAHRIGPADQSEIETALRPAADGSRRAHTRDPVGAVVEQLVDDRGDVPVATVGARLERPLVEAARLREPVGHEQAAGGAVDLAAVHDAATDQDGLLYRDGGVAAGWFHRFDKRIHHTGRDPDRVAGIAVSERGEAIPLLGFALAQDEIVTAVAVDVQALEDLRAPGVGVDQEIAGAGDRGIEQIDDLVGRGQGGRRGRAISDVEFAGAGHDAVGDIVGADGAQQQVIDAIAVDVDAGR